MTNAEKERPTPSEREARTKCPYHPQRLYAVPGGHWVLVPPQVPAEDERSTTAKTTRLPFVRISVGEKVPKVGSKDKGT